MGCWRLSWLSCTHGGPEIGSLGDRRAASNWTRTEQAVLEPVLEFPWLLPSRIAVYLVGEPRGPQGHPASTGGDSWHQDRSGACDGGAGGVYYVCESALHLKPLFVAVSMPMSTRWTPLNVGAGMCLVGGQGRSLFVG